MGQVSVAREDAMPQNALCLLTDQENNGKQNHHGIPSAFPGTRESNPISTLGLCLLSEVRHIVLDYQAVEAAG